MGGIHLIMVFGQRCADHNDIVMWQTFVLTVSE